MEQQKNCSVLFIFLVLIAVPAMASPDGGVGAAPDTDNVLANLEEAPAPPPAAGPAQGSTAKPDEGLRFGQALQLLNIETTWTGYGDLVMTAAPGEAITFAASHFNPILVARVFEKLSVEMELEFEPGAFKAEYLLVDYSPFEWLSLRGGQFLMPFGKFNDTLHPSFRWNMTSRPLMFSEVVPAVWSDVGLQVRGRHRLSGALNVEWQLYAVNGLQRSAMDFAAEDPSSTIVRSMRAAPLDNNADKAFGGHLSLLLFRGRDFGAAELGFSAYTGAVDPVGAWRLTMFDVDASLTLGPVLLRAEAAQTFLNREKSALVAFERGVYAQAVLRLWGFNLALRFDWAETRPGGLALKAQRQLATSLGYALNRFMTLRFEVGLPFPRVEPTYTGMVSFTF